MRHYAECDGYSDTISIPEDPCEAGKSQVANLTKLLAGYKVVALPVSGDKVTRAEPMAAQVKVGNLCILKAPGSDDLIGEMRNFPNSTYDDQIDAISDCFDQMTQSSLRIWEK